MMQLRHYQRAAVDTTWNFLAARAESPCIVLPTGAGKTLVMAELIRGGMEQWPALRVAVLAHTQELVAQNEDKLRRHWPDAPTGIYSAALKRRDRFEPVIFAGIQSVADKAMQLGSFDLILVDEAHRIPLRGEGRYRTFIEGARRANPHVRIAGLTATPYRLGGGPVCGPDYVLNEVAYEARVGDLIREGFLCRPVSKAGMSRIDLSQMHKRNGDYIESELDAASSKHELVEAACDEIVAYGANRRAWIVFAAGSKHAALVTDALRRRGIACACITDKTPAGEREASIDAFQRGTLRCLVNVNILSEGFDAPMVDLVVLMRSTMSAPLYYQQVGRGFRLFPSKDDFLVLDFAGNVEEHGPVDAIRPPKKPGQKATSAAPVKECSKCHAFVPVQTRTCECGHQFSLLETGPRHSATAGDSPILSTEVVKPKAFAVDAVRYSKHEKPGKPPSLKVTYTCGIRFFSEWVCLEHGGEARARACAWWFLRTGQMMVPRTVDHALTLVETLRKPTDILVREHAKFPEILDHAFDDDARAA
ncbi:DNA repair protein RadD [Dokdonella fugitiva]|uniref:DNA repair protein RadD n=1 Tax=Dokdonella fugitiva TaxID=328517 RepID=A0A839EWK8_9GAMM|nr:DEAD/DEAH box helicase [Dokdonella fugitiva]MBA8886099.1 DNA repair protein RadD [Dokdonella fugitiva]